ncbi:MAG: hypothetical protein RLZZ126_597 [Pseudomonadota bacterium]|jgi:glycolate oxidase FAD binding subunit
MDSSLQHLQTQVQAARVDRVPLRIQGGGSKSFWPALWPLGAAASQARTLDTRPHRGIVSYEPSELVVTARCGTPLAELEAALAERGQCLPFEPPHFAAQGAASTATVGGMVAAGLSGPARATVGSVRDYVLGMQIIGGTGEVLNFGGTVMKNVAGYDVSRLMVGSLGTLGLITQVSIKVLPIAPAEATLRFAMDQAPMLHQLNTWGGQPLPLNASSWVNDAGQDVLYLRLRGARAAVESACNLFEHDHGAARVDSAQTRADWQAARDLALPFFNPPPAPAGLALWRLSLPPSAPALPLPHAQLIEWMGGLRWLWASVDDGNLISESAEKMGGSAHVFKANNIDELMEKHSRFSINSKNITYQTIERRLKAQFDPLGVFNPGVMPGH